MSLAATGWSAGKSHRTGLMKAQHMAVASDGQLIYLARLGRGWPRGNPTYGGEMLLSRRVDAPSGEKRPFPDTDQQLVHVARLPVGIPRIVTDVAGARRQGSSDRAVRRTRRSVADARTGRPVGGVAGAVS